MTAAKLVQWDQLLKVVYTAFGAAAGVAIAFSISVAGATRFAESRRAERSGVAVFYAVLVALGLAVCAAAIVLGIVSMTTKR
jgi:hypothetical protein